MLYTLLLEMYMDPNIAGSWSSHLSVWLTSTQSYDCHYMTTAGEESCGDGRDNHRNNIKGGGGAGCDAESETIYN